MLPALVLFRPSGRDLQGRGAFSILGSLYLLTEMLSRPLLFLCPFGTRNPASNSSHEFMEPRRVLLPLRTISAPADCTRPLLGAGRNRYVAAAPAWNRTPGLAAQNNKSRLSVTANKFCLNGWPFKIWSCCPALYRCGLYVCAASTGRVLQPAPGAAAVLVVRRKPIFGTAAPVFSPNYILVCRQDNMVGADGTLAPRPRKYLAKDNESHNHNRQSGNQKHKIPRGSYSTDGGTAVTSPTSRTGGTELRLFLFPHSLQRQHPLKYFPDGRRGQNTVWKFKGGAAEPITSRPFLRPTNQPIYMNRPGAWVKRPGSGRSVIAEDFFITIRHHYDLRPVFRNRINNILRGRAIFSID